MSHRVLPLTLVDDLLMFHFGCPNTDDSFFYIADYVTARKQLGIISGMSYICLDSEHYSYSQEDYVEAKFPLETLCWNKLGPFVALVQITTPEGTYVFDILAIGTFPLGLRELLEGTAVTKIVFDHGSEARAFHNSFGCKLTNVVDLQDIVRQLNVGKSVLGIRLRPGPTTLSLANVTWAYMGEITVKAFQKYHWNWNSLSESALWYAANDSVLVQRLLEFLGVAYWYTSVLKGEATGEPTLLWVRNLVVRLPRSTAKIELSRPPSDGTRFPYDRFERVRQRKRSKVYCTQPEMRYVANMIYGL